MSNFEELNSFISIYTKYLVFLTNQITFLVLYKAAFFLSEFFLSGYYCSFVQQVSANVGGFVERQIEIGSLFENCLRINCKSDSQRFLHFYWFRHNSDVVIFNNYIIWFTACTSEWCWFAFGYSNLYFIGSGCNDKRLGEALSNFITLCC